MDRVLINLLLASLCVVSSWSASSDKLVVTQTSDVSAKEGEMVEISCCWTENIGRVHVNWLKSQTGNKEDLNVKNQSLVFQKKEENNCSSLIFPNISREDAGTYICRVNIEIPVLTVAHGNGTVITVTFKEKTSDNTTGDKVRGASSDKVVVTQSPDVSAKEGEMVEIICCWTDNSERVRVNWMKNQTGNKEDLNMTNQSEVFQKKEENKCSSLTFPSILRKDAGTYTCRVTVEIPFLTVAHGKGTVITVIFKNETSENTTGDKSESPPVNLPVPVIIALAVVVPLLLIAVVCFCTLRKKEAQAARVIYEVPHIDSEVADMDKHSTSSSRGSSQWCQVPVYESFDYFERVETKGGK